MALFDDLLHHISSGDLDSINGVFSTVTDQEVLDIDQSSWGAGQPPFFNPVSGS